MPAVDDPFSIAASLPGQLAELKRQIKDLSANNNQAAMIAALPVQIGYYTTGSNFTLNPGGYILQQSGIIVPVGKTKVTFTVIGQAQVQGLNSTASAYSQMLYGSAGTVTPGNSLEYDTIKIPNGSNTQNGLTMPFGVALTGLVPGDSLFMTMNIFATDVTQFPANAQNLATLSTVATFFN